MPSLFVLFLFLFCCIFSNRNAVRVFRCFPAVVTAQFIFFIYPGIRNQAIAVTFVTQPFQFNFTTTALSRLTIFRLQSVSATSFCPIFLYFLPPTLRILRSEKMRVWYPLSAAESHFGSSSLADLCIWSALAHWIPRATFVNKVDI